MRQIINIAYYELIHILKDKILFLIVFVVPLAYASLFGAVYYSAILTDIPLAIVNLDKSELSREVAAAFYNSSAFAVDDAVTTYTQMEEGMKNGTIRAGIIIPENFARNVFRGQKSTVLTVYDASNLIWGYNIRKKAQEVINYFRVEQVQSYLAASGLSQRQINEIINSVDCNVQVWYNPALSYTNFLFMGLVMMIVHQLGLLSAGLSVTREKENNCWLQFIHTSIPMWKIAIGKCLPYIFTGIFNYALLLWISVRFISVSIQGGTFLILLLGLVYTMFIVFTGFYLSLLVPNSLQITRYLMLLSVPVFLISGYTWPYAYIPEIINVLARLLPFTWMAEAFRLVTLKNVSFSVVMVHTMVLTLMALIPLYLAFTARKERKLKDTSDLSINGDGDYPRVF